MLITLVWHIRLSPTRSTQVLTSVIKSAVLLQELFLLSMGKAMLTLQANMFPLFETTRCLIIDSVYSL